MDSDVTQRDQKVDGSDTGRRKSSVYTKSQRDTQEGEKERQLRKEEELRKALHKTKETLSKEQAHAFDILSRLQQAGAHGSKIDEENKRNKVRVYLQEIEPP